ncbi:MAG TPA: hypothetical protein GX517_12435 [Alicyclobacillus sp.]|nr:hypothetical protein [Alicyclobacillus sp.]
MVLKQMEQWALKWIAAVLAWLQTGWREPGKALRWEQLYPVVVLAGLVVLVVKLTPVVQNTAQNLIQTIGQSLQTIFTFTI